LTLCIYGTLCAFDEDCIMLPDKLVRGALPSDFSYKNIPP